MTSEREQNLINCVEEELKGFRLGTVEGFSATEELAERTGFSARTVKLYLSQNGLSQKRREAMNERKKELWVPSSDLSWLIGVIAAGGTSMIFKHSSVVSLSSYDEELLKKFAGLGEKCFLANASVFIGRKDSKKGPYRKVAFSNKFVAEELGDLRRESWPQTVMEKHQWIFKEQRYLWPFLEGIFEVRGTIDCEEKRRICMNTNYKNVAFFLSDLLVYLGVNRPLIKRDSNTQEGIKGITINNIVDLRKIAENIHSVDRKKEAKLDFYRQNTDIEPQTVIVSDEEVIREWKRLRSLLGHAPKSSEIQELKRRGLTKFSHSVYMDRFGDGTFRGTWIMMEKLLGSEGDPEKARNEAATKRGSHITKKYAQIESDDEVVSEWKRITAMLGHSPSHYDIRKLKAEGKTKYNPAVYSWRFSNVHGIRNFSEARKNLEAIIGERK